MADSDDGKHRMALRPRPASAARCVQHLMPVDAAYVCTPLRTGQNDGSIFDDDDDDDAALLIGGGDQGAGGSNGSAGICCAHDHHMYRALISYCMYAVRIDQALQRKYVERFVLRTAAQVAAAPTRGASSTKKKRVTGTHNCIV